MNIFFILIFGSTLIWSFFSDKYFLLIFYIVLLLINFIQIFLTNEKKSLFFNSIFKKPLNPTIYTGFEIRLNKIDDFLKNYNKRNPENKITYTHIALKALSLGIKKNPETLNYISYTNLKIVENIDISVIIETEKKHLLTKIIKSCENKKISEISKILKKDIKDLKKGNNNDFQKLLKLSKNVKSYTINLILKLSTFLIYNFFFDNSQKKNNELREKISFCAVSNCSKLNTNEGYACHITIGRAAYCLVLNNVQKKPVFVKEGEEGFLEGRVRGVNCMFVSMIGDCRKVGIENFLFLVEDVRKGFEEFEKYI